MERQGEEIHVDTEEARGGKTGMGVRYVLGLSLALVVVLYAVVWLIGSAGPKQSGQADVTTVPAVTAT